MSKWIDTLIVVLLLVALCMVAYAVHRNQTKIVSQEKTITALRLKLEALEQVQIETMKRLVDDESRGWEDVPVWRAGGERREEVRNAEHY